MIKSAHSLWRIVIVTGVLPSRDSKIRGATVRTAKTNTIFKCTVNKLFTIENTYHDTNQTDKTRRQKFRQESSRTKENKREVFEYYKY